MFIIIIIIIIIVIIIIKLLLPFLLMSKWKWQFGAVWMTVCSSYYQNYFWNLFIRLISFRNSIKYTLVTYKG